MKLTRFGRQVVGVPVKGVGDVPRGQHDCRHCGRLIVIKEGGKMPPNTCPGCARKRKG